MLADCGYIEGVKVTDLGEKDDFDSDDYECFNAEFSSPAITIRGLQFLALHLPSPNPARRALLITISSAPIRICTIAL